MKTHRNQGLAALVVFMISFFLPAFEDMSGFGSFTYCWDTFLGHEPFGNVRILSGGWFYYSGFVMCNIFFVGLVAALFVTRKIRRVRSVFSVVCFLQALSWLVLFIFSGKPSQIAAIKVGYYVWLIAYGLLVTAHLRKSMSTRALQRTAARWVVGQLGQFVSNCCDRSGLSGGGRSRHPRPFEWPLLLGVRG
jgi:hypothetical protein